MLKHLAFLALAGLSASQDCSALPSTINYAGHPLKLPDPFTFLNGTKVTTLADWACRRSEISSLLQRYELGPLPPGTPTVAATLTSNRLTITITTSSRTITITPTIRLPTSGSPPFPAVIALGGSPSLPIPSSVAVISYNNEEIAATDPRGRGKFFDLYGTATKTGGLLAWSWGVSRILDALELLGSSLTKIDTKRIAVTGCSRNGKGAMVSGAFDTRIALTLPQEGGTGAMGCWRIVGEMKRNGSKTEDAAQIVTGDQWFAKEFENYTDEKGLAKLPFDHHLLAGMIAPRGLLVVENSGIEYLAPPSAVGCATAGRMVFEGLGATGNMGFSQAAHGSSHCRLPGVLEGDVRAFVERFLLGGVAKEVWRVDEGVRVDVGRYVDWKVVKLG
ncbi:hypothetical protein B0T14DRAFT_146311 [Immersiella caudata]|uniref:(4-O-methyl)-D-glucuronate--lignin esterase n=1 Tax=Immersiella caudata TaxID=314043 RepID=A0AA40C7J8_9PEZI|nr:hypothetical protein B0T14DRAFT_146311 [Immersiella caudata]